MTRSLSAENFAALQQRRLQAAAFLWVVVKHRETGYPIYDGYWSGYGAITCQVIDPETGGATTRTYVGAGGLVSISDVPFSTGLTVRPITITLSQCADRVNDLIRTYECKQGRVEVHRGFFNPDTQEMVAAATPRFVGFIDSMPITTGEAGGDGSVVLTCNSHTQELSRSNPDMRSDASQRLRSPTDSFFADVNLVGDWEIKWDAAAP